MKAADKILEKAKARVEPELLLVLSRIAAPRKSDGPAGAHLAPESLVKAMHYAVTSPGKRLRPALVFAGAEAVGGKAEPVLAAACAVELVHAYSLVHDDLPAMDNAATRRGQPSLHKAMGEATALLAGDALLTEALGLIADPSPKKRAHASARRRLQASFELARAAGAGGMVGGQVDDVEATGKVLGADALRSIHARKTGRLIRAAVTIGGILGGGGDRAVERLARFGTEIGLAFQLIDDVLDQDGLVPILGADQVRQEAEAATQRAQEALQPFGRRGRSLHALAEAMVARLS